MVDNSQTDNEVLAELLEERSELYNEVTNLEHELTNKKGRLENIEEILVKFELLKE
jgi:shikimate kinase